MLWFLKPGAGLHLLWVGVDKRCCSIRGPIWALRAWRLRPIVSSSSVCRSSSETPHGRNLFLPFRCGGVGLGWEGFVLLCDGIACSCVFVGVSQWTPAFPHMSIQPQTSRTCTWISTMKDSHLKKVPPPLYSWSQRRSVVVRAASPPSRLSVRTLWPWRGWSSGRLLHGRGTAAIILSQRRIDCTIFLSNGGGGQLTKINLC